MHSAFTRTKKKLKYIAYTLIVFVLLRRRITVGETKYLGNPSLILPKNGTQITEKHLLDTRHIAIFFYYLEKNSQ